MLEPLRLQRKTLPLGSKAPFPLMPLPHRALRDFTLCMREIAALLGRPRLS